MIVCSACRFSQRPLVLKTVQGTTEVVYQPCASGLAMITTHGGIQRCANRLQLRCPNILRRIRNGSKMESDITVCTLRQTRRTKHGLVRLVWENTLLKFDLRAASQAGRNRRSNFSCPKPVAFGRWSYGDKGLTAHSRFPQRSPRFAVHECAVGCGLN